MSSSQPPSVEIKLESFSALDLDVSPTTGGDSETQRAESSGLHGYSLEAANDSLSATTPSHISHFGDFQFPYQAMQEESTIVAIPEDQSVDVFEPAHRASVSSMADRHDSIGSITAQLPSFGGVHNRRRTSVDMSEDGSQDSNAHGANSLEEPMSDEFGLSVNGPGDGTDLGGKLKEANMDAAPPWSELKTKAGKERKRLPLACIACRRKKIRCSGEKPACKHCLRSRIPCVYKVTARKAAPRTDYMAMLDKRLKRMEERIIKIVPKSEQDGMASAVTRAVVKPAIPGTVPAGKAATKKRAADEAFGPDLDHWARSGAKNRLNDTNKPQTLMIQESEESKLLQEGIEALPSKEIQEHLAEIFFENIYGQAYHLLHKPSYMRKLRAGTLPPVLILSVCAVSARFSSHPKLNTSPNFLRGEEWASHARDIVMRRYEWPNITILTCLLILGLHEFGTCHGGRSWALGGQAIRMAFALQLHKDLEHDPQLLLSGGAAPLSFIDREIRRRTMWACFLMDRFNSSGTDRPTFIKEETIKIHLPIKEKFFQMDMPGPTEDLNGQVPRPVAEDEGQLADAKDNMGVAAYMIRAIAVWGRVINYLNQGGKELDPHPMWSPESEYTRLVKQADDMLSTLPDFLTYTPENLHLHDTEAMANQFLFLHIAIQQNILFMNRFAVSPPKAHSQQDVPKSFVTKAGQKAFTAANRISELLKDAESYLIAAPFVGYCAFLSSTVHIFGIFSGNPGMEATSKRNLATNVKFLAKMKRFWGMFHFMSENLREQYRACADAARQGTPANENSASPIFQYGDWFDRYPHGVSHSDFVDPASYKKKEKGDDAVLEQKPELHTVEEFFTTLSPQNGDGQAPNARPVPLKRKSIIKKAGSAGSRPEQQLEPLLTDLNSTSAEQIQQQIHRRQFSQSLGGQSSGPTSFNPLTIPHSANATSYHALSPISPVAVSQFGHHHNPASFYPPDLLALSLSQQAGGILPQLDRQLVFGAYGSIDPGINGQNVLDGMGWDGLSARDGHGHGHGHGSAASAAATGHRVSQSSHAAGDGPSGSGPSSAADAMHAFGHGHDSSSAWFMPFNMEPPEIGQETMSSLDQFANMFGSGGGMTTPGGMHHGGGH